VDATPIRKSYADDFRRRAVAMVAAENLPLAEVARRLGVNPEVPRKWKRKYAPPTSAADRPEPSPAGEVRRLKEQVRQLATEREIPKRAATFFAKEATRRSRSSAVPWPSGRSGQCAGSSEPPRPGTTLGGIARRAPGPSLGRRWRTMCGPCSPRRRADTAARGGTGGSWPGASAARGAPSPG
jgi:transposase